MANQYIVELRANTKRGIQSKLNKGWKPGLAPVGYINDKYGDKGAKVITTDPERFDLVRKIWDYMLTGNYNPKQVQELADEEWHLTTRPSKKTRGGAITKSGIYRLLSNIFYAGWFEYDGQLYKGEHKPMITLEEFDRVQRILGDRGRPRPQTKEFAFTSKVRCGECGCLVTAETKTKLIKETGEYKDYTYYHCTRRKTGYKCSQRPIRLEDLEPQIDQVLKSVTILPVFKDWALEKLNKANDQEIIDRTKIQEALTQKLEKTQSQLDSLTKMRYRELIDDEEFLKEKRELQGQLARLEEQRDRTEDRAKDWLELTEKTFDFACYARSKFLVGDVRTKREIFAALSQETTLRDGMLSVTPQKWFQPIIKEYPALLEEYERVRTTSYGSIKEQTAAFATVRSHWGE